VVHAVWCGAYRGAVPCMPGCGSYSDVMLCSAGQWCWAVHVYVVLWSVVLWSGAFSGIVRRSTAE
jgi:hypothetical protein